MAQLVGLCLLCPVPFRRLVSGAGDITDWLFRCAAQTWQPGHLKGKTWARRSPHLIGAVWMANYVTFGSLCLVRPGTLSCRAAKLVNPEPRPRSSWPHDAMCRCLKVGEIKGDCLASMTLMRIDARPRSWACMGV